MTARAFLEGLFNTAVEAAHPSNCLSAHLPAPPAAGRLVILAAGKAAGAMAEVAERHYLEACGLPASRIGGLAVTRRGYARPTKVLRVIEAGHPIPDAAGLSATLATLAHADSVGPNDLVLALISGGASANWIAPVAGLSLAEKQALTRALIASGASIGEINTVRKHLSRIKGGRLAAATRATVLGLLLSDVAGDPPDVIGSGPVTPDPTTYADALAALDKYGLRDQVPAVVRAHLEAGERGQVEETPKADHPAAARAKTVIIAGPDHLRSVAVSLAAQGGFAGAGTEKPASGQDVEQLAKHIAHTAHASRSRIKKSGAKPHVFVWVREPSVAVKGDGVGGRNGHLALLVAREIAGMTGVAFLSAGSDGVDGDTPAAGAVVDGGSWNRALAEGLEPAARLERFDSGPVHQKLGTAIVTGRTGTNFMDLQLLAIE